MSDFNQAEPKKSVTNPNPATPEGAPYPKTFYRHSAGEDGSIVVAWDKKTPIHNEILHVVDAKAEKAAIEDGYSAAPVLDAPKDKKKKDKD